MMRLAFRISIPPRLLMLLALAVVAGLALN